MDNATILQYLAVAVGVLSAIIAWLIADAGFKAKISSLEEKVSANKITIAEAILSITGLGNQNAQCDQERKEFFRAIEKLEMSKASKEVVDSFRQEVSQLRLELDRRFDRLDRMMEYRMLGKQPDPDDPKK